MKMIIISSLYMTLYSAPQLLLVWLLRRKSAATRHLTIVAGMLFFFIQRYWLAPWFFLTRIATTLRVQPVAPESVRSVIRDWSIVRHEPRVEAPTTLAGNLIRQANSYPVVDLAFHWMPMVLFAFVVLSWFGLMLKYITGTDVEGIRGCRISRRTRVPLCFWLGRMVVLLPAEWEQWDDGRRSRVLAHEYAHACRWDWVWQMVATFATCTHWMSPLHWILLRLLKREAEQAADDRVVESGADPHLYAQDLLDVSLCAGHSAPAAVGMAGRANMERRIRAVLEPKRRGRAGWAMAPMAVLALVLTQFASAYVLSEPLSENVPKNIAYGQWEPRPSIGTISGTPNNGWLGSTPVGASYELVQISRLDANGVVSWQPDGRPLGAAARPTLRSLPPNTLEFQFALRGGPSKDWVVFYPVGNNEPQWQSGRVQSTTIGGTRFYAQEIGYLKEPDGTQDFLLDVPVPIPPMKSVSFAEFSDGQPHPIGGGRTIRLVVKPESEYEGPVEKGMFVLESYCEVDPPYLRLFPSDILTDKPVEASRVDHSGNKCLFWFPRSLLKKKLLCYRSVEGYRVSFANVAVSPR